MNLLDLIRKDTNLQLTSATYGGEYLWFGQIKRQFSRLRPDPQITSGILTASAIPFKIMTNCVAYSLK